MTAGFEQRNRPYDLAALMRHVPQSVSAIRRVTREMIERGISERWRLAGLLVPGVFFGVENVAREAYNPDPWFDFWRTAAGAPLFKLALFVGSAVASIALAYLLSGWLWIVLRVFRQRTALANVRTAIAASGMPMTVASVIAIGLCAAGFLLRNGADGLIGTLLDGIDIAAGLFGIGYLAAAMSEATGLPALRIVGLQFLAGLFLIFTVVCVTGVLGLVI